MAVTSIIPGSLIGGNGTNWVHKLIPQNISMNPNKIRKVLRSRALIIGLISSLGLSNDRQVTLRLHRFEVIDQV